MMKNHIAFKIAAVLLAALMLLGTVASGCGIVLLSNYDLYNRTWSEGYEEKMRDLREDFAQALVFRYASMELGGCSTPLIDDYYGNGALYNSFRWGRYAYSVHSRNGEELISLKREIPDAVHYEIPVENGRFVYLISEKDVEETTADRIQTAASAAATEAATEAPSEAPAEQTVSSESAVSAVEDQEAEATAQTENDISAAAETAAPAEPTAAAETAAPAEPTAAAETAAPAEPTAAAETAAPAEPTAAAETAAPAEPTAAAETAAAAEPTAAAETGAAAEPTAAAETAAAEEKNTAEAADEENVSAGYLANPYFTRDQYEEAFSYPYYNYESGTMKDATLCYASTSQYTVELYLADDALYDYQMWNLLEILAPMRGQLFAVMGGCLILLAVAVAYLICAAGRKPVTGELQPMGFNQMPLDLYTVLLAAGALGCVWLASAGMELFRNTQMIQIVVAGGACFLGSLLLVCYGLAWTAQIKMKNRWWLRNSLIVRGLKLLWKGLAWLAQKVKALSGRMPEFFAWVKKNIGGWLHKVLQLLPAMYQWLACAGVVLVLILLALAVDSGLIMLLAIAGFVVLTVYGGYCFAMLLRGVKRMRGGELKTKVESDVLLGSMREFAEELNGLADVAGEAAEKQLKSERMKTELITNVSHDIKTPLTSIINYVDLMERPHNEKEQEEYLEVLSRQSQRLKKLIDDLMEMSKASTGNMQTDITEVNAKEAVNQCLGEFTDKLLKADLIPVFRAPDHDVFMMADGRLVWRVMSNLLGNVVKYAMSGTRVYVDLNEIQDQVIISVKNMSREELNISSEELMERFVRGDASRNTEGSGLGLNIAKSLMELQHGQMELLVDGDLFKVTLIFPAK